VARKSKKLPSDIIDHWPEVFNDVHIDVVPIEYLDSIRIGFVDGKTWEIDLKNKVEGSQSESLNDALDDLFADYEDVILNVDFRLNTEKVKEDITKRTKYFLKKRK